MIMSVYVLQEVSSILSWGFFEKKNLFNHFIKFCYIANSRVTRKADLFIQCLSKDALSVTISFYS